MRSGSQAGISLVEALVALVVMSFGTLAVLGVQSTLRFNGDVSKQRAEAVRIAQEAMEDARSFSGIAGADEDVAYFGDIADSVRTVDGLNATFTVTTTVQTVADPRRKTVQVQVGWQDRGGNAQAVQFDSAIFGTTSAFAGTLVIPANRSPIRNPGGRHGAIPPAAVDQGDGSSRFAPPGAASGVSWVFNNRTGYITRVCTAVESCIDSSARLLAGYVRFDLNASPSAELPGSARLSDIQVRVVQTAPAAVAGTLQCFEDTSSPSWVAYYCAVPTDNQVSWSGQALVGGSSLDLANSIADGDADEHRVCRYTPYRAHLTAPTQMRNDEHPLVYSNVTESLTNQNFLVMRAGNGDADPWACPDDVAGTPVNGTTWHHQPSS
ncbi:MAG: pilus assembly protein PilV [Burkholderiaceae bacterium]|nr:pilus assembly protein PilV [Rhodoferax sp.]MCP5283350.1 pilus assembly protein PilV [Burkholderiaceae bacterium]